MECTPNFSSIKGTSTLFDTGDAINQLGNHTQDNQKTKPFPGLNSFVSSTGKVVNLRLKKLSTSQVHYPSRFGSSGLDWRDDETYGININALLDKIEVQDAPNIQKTVTKSSRNQRRGELLVEKWRPKSFLDLVGNEKTNRRVLRWLRQWSPCVFNEALPKNPRDSLNNTDMNDTSNNEQFDPLQRPQKRILLIHGPPGIGKTSVTHVVAKQAGFSVAEINASDERAGTAVRDKVHNTLFNHTFNENAVCLIADEIDGSVESGFIKVLIDIIINDSKATQKLILGSHAKSKKKNKKKSSRLLLRPIIAICNNLYAPALEKLKPHCEIISFRRPSDGSLQERLEHICHTERLDISLKIMKDLMELSQGDIRNCINNLQFLAFNSEKDTNKKKDEKNKVESSGKDFATSWFRICNELFRKNPHKDSKSQIHDLARKIELNGNYDRIVQGCHSLYPLEKYSDSGIRKPAALSDWLIFHDLMLKSLFEHNGELLRYSAVVPLAFHNFFGDIANREDKRILQSDFEFKEQQKGVSDICKLLLHKICSISPSKAPFIDYGSLITEYLPYIDIILSSDVNKCRDLKMKQAIYDAMAGILREFQLSFQQKFMDGLDTRHVLGIDPPIDKVVLLDPKRQKEVLTKRPTIYNVLLAKSEESKARKRHIHQVIREKEKNVEIQTKRSKVGSSTVDFFKTQYGLTNKENAELETEQTTKSKDGDRNETHEESIRIWVKYKEGFSDAVRKNVSWDNLWE